MHTTPVSLLERLRQPAGDQAAWEHFVKLYTPLLFSWGRATGLGSDEAADLVQDVFTVLVQKMPHFVHDKQHRFRAWLRTVLMNKWRNRMRRPPPAPLHDGEAGEAPAADPLDMFAEAEYQQYLVRRALELMQRDFQATTWKAFWEVVVVGRAAREVGRELGLSVNSVYVARVRVLSRLREELAGLLE
jgi:RNA polymerase sigma-70 factor (ECF subfamily)